MAERTSYRNYISYNKFKNDAGVPDDSDETKIKRAIRDASRRIEEFTGRKFIPCTATRTFDFQHGYYLWLDDDLIERTSVVNDGDTITAADILEYPPTGWTRRLEINRSSSSFFNWTSTPQQCIQVTGKWSYCDDYEDTGTTTAASLSASDTVVTVADGHQIEEGWCLLVESEQMFVSDVSINSVTVIRGVNGTTAATHATGTTIYRYQPPDDIERACYVLTARWLKRGEASWADRTGSPEAGYEIYGEMPGEVKEILLHYRWLGPEYEG